ncbi:MAG TPA: GNAT family N-acetyltransferase [Kofleriaceae bacterium]
MLAIRDATPDDYADYARLFPELGVDDRLPSHQRFTDELLARTLVASEDGTIVGYALCEVLADVGYIRNLVSDPARRRTGIGVALMAALRDRFLARGATAWCLNVKPDNAAAVGLYERCGLRAAYRSWTLRVPSSVQLPPVPANVTIADSPSEDDAVIEAKFGLLRGQLASGRSRPSRRCVQLRRGEDPVGIGIFSPAIPGAFPFRISDPALAAAFLAQLRALAPTDATHVQVVVEDDGPLHDAILALGGYLLLEILHMRGPLG